MTPPPLAVTVIFVVPAVAALVAVKVKDELPVPDAAIEVGLKVAVTPVGSPEAASEMEELNPPAAVVVIVVFAELPWVTDRLVGEALNVKSGVAVVGLKMMSMTECNSIWLGAAPV